MNKQQRLNAVPRNALQWLLIAQVLVIAPHLLHIPQWIAGLWLLCALWRIQVYRTRWSLPPPVVKLAMMSSAAFAVYLSRGSLIGLDAGVALLITAFTLKLVELRSRRDALVLVFLGFFCVVTSYLYYDSLLAALYSLLPVTALLAAWTGLQQSDRSVSTAASLRLALVLLAQAVPLALLLFIFFPRVEPLWSLPQPSEKGRTGLSSQMSPGDIAELSQSTALAFRATFEGPIPPKSQLYWRALTMPLFDGRSWRMASFGTDLLPGQWHKQGPSHNYSVIMQPSRQPWLFSLDISESSQADVRMLGDFRLQRSRPVHRTYLYQAEAWPQAIAEPGLTAAGRRHNLQLPHTGNPRTREWSRQLREQYADDRQLVAALLAHFNQHPYHYTLRPPLLGEHSIDEFMFDTRRGFCEHYSSAMTFALRVAGIPARVVTGYQGGEINSAGNYVQVRQMDAHAWVEYWLPGSGWQRADPTFQVAPERIEQSLQDVLGGEMTELDSNLLSPLRYRHVAWINSLRLGWENLNHGWQSKVLGYQGDRQRTWLRQLFGTLDWQRIGVVLVTGMVLLLGVLALIIIRPWQHQPDPAQRMLQTYDRLLQRRGLARSPQEGMQAHLQRIGGMLDARQRQQLESFVRAHERLQYAECGNLQETQAALHQLKRSMGFWHQAKR